MIEYLNTIAIHQPQLAMLILAAPLFIAAALCAAIAGLLAWLERPRSKWHRRHKRY